MVGPGLIALGVLLVFLAMRGPVPKSDETTAKDPDITASSSDSSQIDPVPAPKKDTPVAIEKKESVPKAVETPAVEEKASQLAEDNEALEEPDVAPPLLPAKLPKSKESKKKGPQSEDVVVIVKVAVPESNGIVVTGYVQNKSKEPVEGFVVLVTIVSRDGKSTARLRANAPERLLPDERGQFNIKVPVFDPDAYSQFKVEVFDAGKNPLAGQAQIR